MKHSEIEATREHAFVGIEERGVTGLIICISPSFTERWKKLFENSDLVMTMIYTHVLNRSGRGVRSPLDGVL